MHLSGKPPSKQGIPIKIVVDDNVDRFGVEVLWGMKLTNTNYLIDLIIMCMFNLIKHMIEIEFTLKNLVKGYLDRWWGDYSFLVPPDPIPNSDVKQKHANGTSA